MSSLDAQDFQNLLRFRVQLRRFNRWSEAQARAAGLTHPQHQLLLAVKGHPGPASPTIGEAAEYLLLRHHSAVELANRVESMGLLRRVRDGRDARVVRLELTDKGDVAIAALTALHLAELSRLAPHLDQLVDGIDDRPIFREPPVEAALGSAPQ